MNQAAASMAHEQLDEDWSFANEFLMFGALSQKVRNRPRLNS